MLFTFVLAGGRVQAVWYGAGCFLLWEDALPTAESSLREDFYRQGWNQWSRIIPGRGFCSVGMKSVEKNHLWERILFGRDEISGEESSLRENFYRQGWNQWGRIISGRRFLLAGMKSAEKNHPWEKIFINRDEISIAEGPAFSEFEVVSLFWTQRG